MFVFPVTVFVISGFVNAMLKLHSNFWTLIFNLLSRFCNPQLSLFVGFESDSWLRLLSSGQNLIGYVYIQFIRVHTILWNLSRAMGTPTIGNSSFEIYLKSQRTNSGYPLDILCKKLIAKPVCKCSRRISLVSSHE